MELDIAGSLPRRRKRNKGREVKLQMQDGTATRKPAVRMVWCYIMLPARLLVFLLDNIPGKVPGNITIAPDNLQLDTHIFKPFYAIILF